jgi:pimeloyl-ACP methyl ester carboxylesterase
MTVAFVEIAWRARKLRIEHAFVGVDDANAPLLIFLHEGLGSLAMWKAFPAQLCEALGARGLVYSRPGYGRSTPRASDEHWAPDFMHQQAHEVLPALLQALGIDAHRQPPWLFGHSDGGSIALLHAAQHPVAGVVVVAPHLFVEDISLTSIAQARTAYTEGALKPGLAKYHDDPDSAFYGWNDVWLSPAFRPWNIEADIASISAPLLAVQGVDDEYGTLAQIRNIRPRVPQAQLLEIPACGHSPHRDQPQVLIAAVRAFVQDHRPS